MTPRMSNAEQNLFESFLCASARYVEFGSGGSTVLACSVVREAVTSIDSSPQWLEDVRMTCSDRATPVQPVLIYADIGPTQEWGFPAGGECRNRWPNYHSKVWENANCIGADCYLIDGRFRVACFLQTLLHSNCDITILVHDFLDRPDYHVVKQFSDEIARQDSLSVFRPHLTFDRKLAYSCLEAHSFIPA